jgi:hypothetical protein
MIANHQAPMLVASVRFAVFVLSLSASALSAQPLFKISTIESGDVRGQTVVSAHLVDPRKASLVLLTVDAEDDRNISLFELENGLYVRQLNVDNNLGDDVILVDEGRLGNKDILVLFSRNAVWQYDPYTGIRKELVRTSSLYGSKIFGLIPRMDLFRDLNGDGLDDLIIPNFGGFRVFIQNAAGEFSGPLDIDAPPMVDMSYNNFPWYQPKSSFLSDMTLDGKNDLIFWIDDAFSIFSQNNQGRFMTVPQRFKPSVQFQYDGLEGMNIAMQDEDQSDISGKALSQISDFDGDGISDLVTLSIRSEGVFKKQTTYDFHKGIAGDGQVEFSPFPDSRIKSKGIQFEMEEKDFNNDGQTDMVISAVELGIGKVLGALITGSIDIDLNFYQMKDGRYADKPDLKREITATFNLSSGDVFIPSVIIADVDGDGIDDLLVQEGENKLKIYLGGKDDQIFARKSIDYEVAMPTDPDLIDMVDLNSDGKQDIVMRHQTIGEDRKVVIMVSE